MRSLQRFTIIVAVATALALPACSGGKHGGSSTTATTTTQSSPAAVGSPAAAPGSPAPGIGSRRSAGSANMSCANGEPPVWANTRTHVYHLPSDPVYGHTKRGKYMCKGDAIAAGYHAAGSRRHHRGGAMNGAQAQPSPSPAM